jgi:hypothetical protein
MSVATEIQRILTAKDNIKNAIENKGVTVGDGTIDTYAEKIGEIVGAAAGGRLPKGIAEMQTGSFTVAEDTNETQYVAFNMQETPTNFIVYADNDEQTTYTFLCLFYGDLFKSFTGVDKQFLVHHGTNATNYGGGQRSFTQGGVKTIDKSGVSFSGFSTSYYFRSSIKYNWIAWREGELDYDYNDYEQGYEDGKNSVVPIERYLKTATFTSLNMFGKSEVELNLDNVTSLNGLFKIMVKDDVNTTVEHLIITAQNPITSISQILFSGGINYDDKKLKRVTTNFKTQICKGFSQSFNGCEMLEIIDGEPLDFSAALEGSFAMFNRCYALKELRVVNKSIKVNFNIASSAELSHETRQSIIDGLADLTGGTAQTLTLHATVGGKLTDEQKATITAKNWTLVY